MNSPKPPPSQASSHFPLEPIPASVLAEKEARRRDAIALLGPCKTGCAVVDEDILLGGFDRASIVGVSAEDEELGVQLGLQTLAHSLYEGTVTNGLLITPKPASVMLTGLRDAIKAELQKRAGTQDIKTRLRECLDKVMLSRVFDLDGLWEVLADLDPKQPVDEEAILLHQEKETRKQDATETQVEEIQDSQDDDDEAFSPIRQASQPPLHEENSTSKATPHPEVIVMTHFSSLLTSLFAHREKSAARTALQLLGSRLRDLSRNLPSNPLILLLNSTSSSFSGPASTTTAISSAKQAFIDPTLRSIFNPPSATGYSSRRTKPNFGLSFTQLLDLHILCTRIPKTRTDAELSVQPRSGEEAKMVWAVEVLLDEMGVWEGKLGARTGREQRWTAIDVVKGRIEHAFNDAEE
ncbi:hypothetical protein FLAG1_04702 [Fusarium langsethiae]|uniref:Uncharacterized protein n=1 Tax=Fusarium langsethiae TaxID=179993 RepID=A0A0N0DFD5_FUSLA|nr:hypothetical protein FLAG1_04702 [Fusarium langsethiae]GKU05152.1 unnamed protein product [Fusarium langsethiae]GKU17905.1 unnamed protein product [Fusarium langsethiae]